MWFIQRSGSIRLFSNLSKRNLATLNKIIKTGKVLSATGLGLYAMTSTSRCDDLKKVNDNENNEIANTESNNDESNGDGPSAPKKDVVEQLIAQVGPYVGQIGFGSVMGFCTGVAFKKIGQNVAYVIGLTFAGLQGLNYLGYIKIDFLKISEDAKMLMDADNDGKLTPNDFIILWRQLKAILTANLPSAASFSAGLALGFKLG